MSELPITKKEYEKSALVADFIHKIKNIFETDVRITEFCFSPKIKGYEISYKKNSTSVNISIKLRRLFAGMRIKITGSIGTKTFSSKTAEDNSAVLKGIFNL